MEIWQAIVLGAVQGFTEFLPVSSSGHLILLQNYFGIQEGALFFSIMLHLGTLIPVVIVLWKQIVEMFKKPFNKLGYLVLATIPAGVVGLAVSFLDLDAFFANHIWLLSVTFTLTAVEMLFSEIYCKKTEMANPINCKTALIMGGGQMLGVFPGLSRSGTTITFGCIGKVKREDNANFAFLMSIPIILAAVLLEGLKCVKAGTLGNIPAGSLLIGIFTAMICGYISIKFMMNIIKKANYKWFSLYLVLLSIANVIVFIARG